jgi:hypothetical protein
MDVLHPRCCGRRCLHHRREVRAMVGVGSLLRAGATISRGRAVGRHFVRMHHGRRAFAGSRFGPNYYPYYDSDYYQEGASN